MKTLQHKFVEFIPDRIEEGVIYVSMEYCTAIHKCVCGCGNEVVTPISPTDWQLTFDGESISLSPSIGNWSFDCQSHYWIVKNKIKHSGKMTKADIDFGRKNDREKKTKYFSEKKRGNNNEKKIKLKKTKTTGSASERSILKRRIQKILDKFMFMFKRVVHLL